MKNGREKKKKKNLLSLLADDKRAVFEIRDNASGPPPPRGLDTRPLGFQPDRIRGNGYESANCTILRRGRGRFGRGARLACSAAPSQQHRLLGRSVRLTTFETEFQPPFECTGVVVPKSRGNDPPPRKMWCFPESSTSSVALAHHSGLLASL